MNSPSIVKAYNAIAVNYDTLLEEDKEIRLALWKHYLSCFSEGEHVLDVACGTGIDSLFLAESGIYVTGIDISPEMISQLQDKLKNKKLTDYVTPRVHDVNNLATMVLPRFNGIISAFAGLNSICNLNKFAARAADLLLPGGIMILHVLNRCSMWKKVSHIIRFQWDKVRNLHSQSEREYVISGQTVKHWVYPPSEYYKMYFEPYFELNKLYGLGIFYPPFPAHPIVAKFDNWCGKYRLFNDWGRFFVIELKKRSNT